MTRTRTPPADTPPHARRHLALDTYALTDIERAAPRTLACVRASLARHGAIVITAEGAHLLHMRSLDAALSFFHADAAIKAAVDGRRYYAARHGDTTLAFRYAGAEHHRSVAELLGAERGWVPCGTSPSGANKEYLQYGVFGRRVPDGLPGLKHNLWPCWPDRAQTCAFRVAKIEQTRFHARLHRAMLALLGSELSCSGQPAAPALPPDEIICRDTFYHPHPAAPAAGAADRQVPRPIRNPAHVDLSNGTLVHYREGLQLYAGRQRQRAAICHDEAGWLDLDSACLPPDALIYLVGLATEIATRGRYLAAWHRVVCSDPPGMHGPRLSIVSFCNAGIDDVLPGGNDLRASGFVYPPIERTLLPVIGNIAYLESARAARNSDDIGTAAALAKRRAKHSDHGFHFETMVPAGTRAGHSA